MVKKAKVTPELQAKIDKVRRPKITAAEADGMLARAIAAASDGTIAADEALRRLRTGDITTEMLDALTRAAVRHLTSLGLGTGHGRKFVRKVLGKEYVFAIEMDGWLKYYVEYAEGGDIVDGPYDTPGDLIRGVLRWKAVQQ